MSDLYPLTAPVVKADGAELSQASVQLAFNTLAGAVRIFLNQIGTGGTFVNPTITGGTIDNTVIGGLVPAAGTFTSLNATTLTLTNIIPFFATGMLAWFNSLPTTLPGAPGVLWNNGGVLSQS